MRLITFYLVNLDWTFLFKIFGLKRQPPDGKAELILFFFFLVYILLPSIFRSVFSFDCTLILS
jgi:hypothetical protein